MTSIYYNYYTSSSLFHGSILNIMGTRLDLVMIVDSLDRGVRVWDKLVIELERLETMLSRFSTASEIGMLNQSASEHPVAVSNELWDIISECKEYHRLTLGLFDITLRDFDKVELNQAEKTVFFKNSEIKFDFGGFAKGYAVEQLKKILLKAKISKAFINFGNSSIGCIGSHPYGENWSVSIENPFQPGQVLGKVQLMDTSLSVSGNTPNYSRHIVRPESGEFVEGKKLVSITTFNASLAEVLSTTFLLATESEKSVIHQNFRNVAVYDEKEYYAE